MADWHAKFYAVLAIQAALCLVLLILFDNEDFDG